MILLVGSAGVHVNFTVSLCSLVLVARIAVDVLFLLDCARETIYLRLSFVLRVLVLWFLFGVCVCCC